MKICGTFSNMEEALKLCRKELSNFQIPSKIELVDETEVFSVEKKKKKIFELFFQPRQIMSWLGDMMMSVNVAEFCVNEK